MEDVSQDIADNRLEESPIIENDPSDIINNQMPKWNPCEKVSNMRVENMLSLVSVTLFFCHVSDVLFCG